MWVMAFLPYNMENDKNVFIQQIKVNVCSNNNYSVK